MRLTFENDETGECGEELAQWIIRNEDTDNRDIVAIVPKTMDEDYDNKHTYPLVKLLTAAPQLLKICQTILKVMETDHAADGSLWWISPGQTGIEALRNVIEDATT